MNKRLFIIFLIIFQVNFLFAQDGTKSSNKIYRVWVDMGKGSKRAYLARISDSVIYTSEKPISFAPDTVNTTSYTSASYSAIKTVRVMRKGSSGKGFLEGLGIGAASGALIGLASGNDKGDCFICFTAGEKALFDAIIFGVISGITCALHWVERKEI